MTLSNNISRFLQVHIWKIIKIDTVFLLKLCQSFRQKLFTFSGNQPRSTPTLQESQIYHSLGTTSNITYAKNNNTVLHYFQS